MTNIDPKYWREDREHGTHYSKMPRNKKDKIKHHQRYAKWWIESTLKKVAEAVELFENQKGCFWCMGKELRFHHGSKWRVSKMGGEAPKNKFKSLKKRESREKDLHNK